MTLPHDWTIQNVKKFLIKESKFRCSDSDEKCIDKLDIPLNNDGYPFQVENLGDDQCQAFYHVMKTMQDWIAYNKLKRHGNLDKKI